MNTTNMSAQHTPGPLLFSSSAQRKRHDEMVDRVVATLSGEKNRAEEEHSQLRKFYGVSTDAELIAAQARHIEKLQAKLPPTPSLASQRVREG